MKIKICGIKNKNTLLYCEAKKIDFYGLIFYPSSPRNIDIESAKLLQIESNKLNINGVGVFVNEEIDRLIQYAKYLNLKYVQLHGKEDQSYINELKTLDIKVIKKISVSDKDDFKNMKNFKDVDYFLFDYKPKTNELPGGNAKSFDWKIIENIRFEKPWFLSGGINVDNIQLIKSKIKPFGIDLSSGVEKKLGIKDNQIINNFMEKLNNA